jgi:hypothetical protein
MLPASAGAATGPLKHATAAHIAFALPSTYEPLYSISTGKRLPGDYERVIKVSDTVTCVVSLSARGELRRSPPSGGATFVLRRHGRRGGLRWYFGHAGGLRVAYAWERAPQGIATRRLRYVGYRLTAPTYGRGACTNVVDGQQPVFVAAIRSMRVTRGAAA